MHARQKDILLDSILCFCMILSLFLFVGNLNVNLIIWQQSRSNISLFINFNIFLITGCYVLTPQGWNSLSNSLITSTPTQRNPPHSLTTFNSAEGGNLYQLVLQALLGQQHKLTHVCVCAEQEI